MGIILKPLINVAVNTALEEQASIVEGLREDLNDTRQKLDLLHETVALLGIALNVTVCPDCGGRLRLIAALPDPVSVRRYLHGVGLPTDRPPLLPAIAPPQQGGGLRRITQYSPLHRPQSLLVGRRTPSKSA